MGLERRTPLERGSSQLRRSKLNARSATNSRAPKRKARVHRDTRGRARSRSGGLCVVCLHRAGVPDVRKLSMRQLNDLVERGVRASRILHHVFPEQKWPHLAKVEDNLVDVCQLCHDDHERAARRIPRAALPAVALELGEREGLGWYVEATYPA